MKYITTAATLLNSGGYIAARGVTVIDHGNRISIGRDDYPKTEVVITDSRITSKNGKWEVILPFSSALKQARNRIKLTQKEAAALLETPPRTYWEWENEKTTPSAIAQEGALARLSRKSSEK